MNSDRPVLLWLRRDLRITDNPALAAAIETGRPVVPVFIRAEGKAPYAAIGGASVWWRGRSLAALEETLRSLGGNLILRSGNAAMALRSLAQDTAASTLVFNRSYEPGQIAEDAEVIHALRDIGLEILEHPGNRLHEPWKLRTGTGGWFKVFTPFWRRLAADYRSPEPIPAPRRWNAPESWPESEPVQSWQIEALWKKGMAGTWVPGERAALARLDSFLAEAEAYPDRRDRPDWEGTSRFSPHLAWGEISVHEIWRRLAKQLSDAATPFLRQLGWRDFNSHLLYHFPELPMKAWSGRFERFPFEANPELLKTWQGGRTGYPIVDAGMRQLWATGWMHNRVRMIAASFLIKDLLTDWRAGEAWFWETLVDADLAQNAGNWQWVAGSGADAAPYFRIFNPVTQSRKFDPEGDYLRRWVPELAKLEGKRIHAPWEAAPMDLVQAGIALGRDYPYPIVDHDLARRRALEAYKATGA